MRKVIQADKKSPKTTQPKPQKTTTKRTKQKPTLKYIFEVWHKYGKEKWVSHAALDMSKWLLSAPLQSRAKK